MICVYCKNRIDPNEVEITINGNVGTAEKCPECGEWL